MHNAWGQTGPERRRGRRLSGPGMRTPGPGKAPFEFLLLRGLLGASLWRWVGVWQRCPRETTPPGPPSLRPPGERWGAYLSSETPPTAFLCRPTCSSHPSPTPGPWETELSRKKGRVCRQTSSRAYRMEGTAECVKSGPWILSASVLPTESLAPKLTT